MLKFKSHWLWLACSLSVLAGALFCHVPAARADDLQTITNVQTIPTVQTITNDMTLAPDAAPHGVPSSFSWSSGRAEPQPMPVPAKNWKGEWFRAATAWGQVYIPTQGSAATNTRCQVRNLVTKFLRKDGTWVTVQSSPAPLGAAYVEDFAGNSSISADPRDESHHGGGVSVLVGIGPYAGHNYHFWPSGGRAPVDINTVIGIYTACEARLIVANPALPDDRARCKNLLQMGADWWLDTDGDWRPDWSANSGIGGMRAKWVTPQWQTFNFCTRTPADVLAAPPVGPQTDKRPTRRSAQRSAGHGG